MIYVIKCRNLIILQQYQTKIERAIFGNFKTELELKKA
jgi:hypothetical protein